VSGRQVPDRGLRRGHRTLLVVRPEVAVGAQRLGDVGVPETIRDGPDRPPSAINSDAWKWRSSCQPLRSRSPSFSATSCHTWPADDRSIGPPTRDVKTIPSGPTPYSSRCSVSTLMVDGPIATTLPADGVFGGPKNGAR